MEIYKAELLNHHRLNLLQDVLSCSLLLIDVCLRFYAPVVMMEYNYAYRQYSNAYYKFCNLKKNTPDKPENTCLSAPLDVTDVSRNGSATKHRAIKRSLHNSDSPLAKKLFRHDSQRKTDAGYESRIEKVPREVDSATSRQRVLLQSNVKEELFGSLEMNGIAVDFEAEKFLVHPFALQFFENILGFTEPGHSGGEETGTDLRCDIRRFIRLAYRLNTISKYANSRNSTEFKEQACVEDLGCSPCSTDVSLDVTRMLRQVILHVQWKRRYIIKKPSLNAFFMDQRKNNSGSEVSIPVTCFQ